MLRVFVLFLAHVRAGKVARDAVFAGATLERNRYHVLSLKFLPRDARRYGAAVKKQQNLTGFHYLLSLKSTAHREWLEV